VNKYSQIFADIVADIDNQRLQKGERIPSESELMNSYAASRGTVRKAVDQLQERGYVQKIHGKGVFVLKPGNIEFQLSGIVSFKESYERLGRAVTTQIADLQSISADKALAKLLQVAEKTELVRIKRVRNIDGENVILDINYFVADLIPGLTPQIAQNSIYEYIEKVLKLNICYAQRVFEAQPCIEDDRRYLDLNGMDHVIVVKNHTHFYDGRQFEYTESRHRLDKFFFSDIARRSRPNHP
jgi:GntR family trehalose operon transcriptional repressor